MHFLISKELVNYGNEAFSYTFSILFLAQYFPGDGCIESTDQQSVSSVSLWHWPTLSSRHDRQITQRLSSWSCHTLSVRMTDNKRPLLDRVWGGMVRLTRVRTGSRLGLLLAILSSILLVLPQMSEANLKVIITIDGGWRWESLSFPETRLDIL